MWYFPDYKEKQLPDKTYLLNVINTEENGKLDKVLQKSKLFRKKVDNDRLMKEEQTIEIKNKTIISIMRNKEEENKKGGKHFEALLKKIQKPIKKRQRKFEVKLFAFDEIETKKFYPPPAQTTN